MYRDFIFCINHFSDLYNTYKASLHLIKIKEVKKSLPSVEYFHCLNCERQIYTLNSNKKIFLIDRSNFYEIIKFSKINLHIFHNTFKY